MIELKQVNKDYKMGSETISALKNINLTIQDGEILSLIGPSGSGKTTILNLIGGLEQPTSGQVIVNNQNIAKLKDNKIAEFRSNSLGYIFQNFNLLPRYNVLKNITLPRFLNKPKSNFDQLEILKSVGLEHKADYLPNKLSGGERQRVAIARALTNNPSIILADEPTGNLDAANAKNIMDLLLAICHRDKKTLVLVTHNPELAKLTDRSIQVKDGEIVGGVI